MTLRIEEICLMTAYGIQGREALADVLSVSLTDLQEPELQDLAKSTAAKLKSMTDDEFNALDCIPDFDIEPEGDDETEG